MDKIQKFLVTAGRKDLAQEYYDKIASVPPAEEKFKIERIMTPDEAKQKAKKLNLENKIIDFIVSHFEAVSKLILVGEATLEDCVSGNFNGTISMQLSRDDVYEDLGKLMGTTNKKEIDKVFDEFFTE